MNQLYASKEKDPGNIGSNADQARMMDDDTMSITAYRRDILGMTCLALYALETTGMVVLLLVMTYDYYNDFLLFRGDKLIQTSVSISLQYQQMTSYTEYVVDIYWHLVHFRWLVLLFGPLQRSFDQLFPHSMHI